MLTPKPRGSLSEAVFAALRAGLDTDHGPVWPTADADEDAAVSLWVLYELHYRGLDDVGDELEWHPALLALRHQLEGDLEARLRARFPGRRSEGDFGEEFFGFVANHDGPSLAAHVQRDADRDQVLELLRVRSIYHLKEADPTAWVVPRLPVATKAALMELLYDEYGVGDPNRLHAHLWALGMEACGLESDYGAYIDEVPTEILEQNNAMSLFGLHRRLRGAALGHLAAFEATSSMPSRRMAQGLERLDLPRAIVDYYTEHIEADAVHEQLAVRTVCGSLVAQEPGLTDDVYFGAFTCLDLENRVAVRMLSRWGVLEGDEGAAA
ncbi:iron-containing redox enzyme family protein [Nocardioides sp.]|uniref:iron-containing redox enzyme family protein n=1 Tax=Nocardioides sp. TaxID=35761 RepID=UPI0031FEF51B|nr:hypothetical protein [Nocardioides sp.]